MRRLRAILEEDCGRGAAADDRGRAAQAGDRLAVPR